MLVLTRKIGEAIHIGGDVRVKVLGIAGNQVRIGVDAPPTTPVHREEVAKRIAHSGGAGVTSPLPLGGTQ